MVTRSPRLPATRRARSCGRVQAGNHVSGRTHRETPRLLATIAGSCAWHEPDESRGSRPDLWEPGGVIPPGDPAGPVVAERDRLQSGEPLAAARGAEEDRHLVADKSATARPAREARPVLLAVAGGRLPMSRGPRATMAGCGEESHMERRCRPAVMEGEAVMPAPAAVKGSAHGPLRALDRGSRRHHLANMTAGQM